jgi:hypothetical protein
VKVVQHTQDVLVLRPTGTGLLLALFGLLFFVIGLGLTFAMGQTVHLTCERLEDRLVECKVRRSFLGLPVGATTVGGVRGAYVAERVDDDGDRTYRVELVTANGHEPAVGMWSSGYAKKADLAEEVDAFVADSTASTLETELPRSLWILFGLPFALAGLVMAALGIKTSATTWTFDRFQGVASRRVSKLTGPHVTEYPLVEIAAVRLESDSDGDAFRIVLWMADGGRVPMLGYYSSGRREKRQTIELIRGFLGLDVSDVEWPIL